MPTEGHWDYCCCASCYTDAHRERALLSKMTFHERKAYRIAKREREDRHASKAEGR